MSSVFSKPSTPKVKKQAVIQQPVEIAEAEDSAEAARRRRRALLRRGAASTRISGIRSAVSSALKRRLGE